MADYEDQLWKRLLVRLLKLWRKLESVVLELSNKLEELQP
jgi:hypothetical protein